MIRMVLQCAPIIPLSNEPHINISTNQTYQPYEQTKTSVVHISSHINQSTLLLFFFNTGCCTYQPILGATSRLDQQRQLLKNLQLTCLASSTQNGHYHQPVEKKHQGTDTWVPYVFLFCPYFSESCLRIWFTFSLPNSDDQLSLKS